jgi:AraC-like DNA-binding protein
MVRVPTTEIARHRSRRVIAGIGRIYLWNGGSLWIGRNAGRTGVHQHPAIQITLAQDRPVLLRSAADGEWAEYHGAVVRHHRSQQFDGRGASVAQIFIEPETEAGHALIARQGEEPIRGLTPAPVAAPAAPLFACFHASKEEVPMIAATQTVIAQLAVSATSRAATDHRVPRVLEALRTRLQVALSLAQGAALVHLSPGRFRHLFVEQTGTSFRAYVLWLRLLAALQVFNQGHNWTNAAHPAGFADSTHLSRTFRCVFGVTPVMLIRD